MKIGVPIFKCFGYIATPATHVLTHTSTGAIGMTTRSGNSLQTFQDTILARQELTNLGIMKSPGTGSMILSMYCPIFEGGRCTGYVGAGVYASHLLVNTVRPSALPGRRIGRF